MAAYKGELTLETTHGSCQEPLLLSWRSAIIGPFCGRQKRSVSILVGKETHLWYNRPYLLASYTETAGSNDGITTSRQQIGMVRSKKKLVPRYLRGLDWISEGLVGMVVVTHKDHVQYNSQVKFVNTATHIFSP